MKPLVIYHASCADGFGAAFAAWLKLGDEAEYVPCKYNDLAIGQLGAEFKQHRLIDGEGKLYPIDDREVYILDFSLHKSLMDVVFANARRVVWLDHHKTAFEMWCGKYEKGDIYLCNRYGPTTPCEIVLNDNKSGAMLAWEYFQPGEEVPMAIRMIDDRDRWQFKISGTKEFSAWLFSLQPWSFKQWIEIGMGDTYPTHGCYDQGEAILRAHDQNVQSVVKGSARKCNLTSFGPERFGLAANCPPHLTSDVGHELANKSGTFGLCWTLGQTGTIAKCSLRSNGDYDVSAIAKAFGGGGHRNAAGFEVDIQVLLGWLR